MCEAKTVLIVDDDEQVAGFLSELLSETEGVEQVLVAGDGFDAGAKVQSFKPDCIVLDLMMPGMNGFEVCRRLKHFVRCENLFDAFALGPPALSHGHHLWMQGTDDDRQSPHGDSRGQHLMGKRLSELLGRGDQRRVS